MIEKSNSFPVKLDMIQYKNNSYNELLRCSVLKRLHDGNIKPSQTKPSHLTDDFTVYFL